MKITSRQLKQIIREELAREMHSPAPPNLRLASSSSPNACGTCAAFCPETGTCAAFGDYRVSADMVCDAWQPLS